MVVVLKNRRKRRQVQNSDSAILCSDITAKLPQTTVHYYSGPLKYY